MFGGKNKAKTVKVKTLISQDTEINGGLVFCGGLHLDGVIKGEVSAATGDSRAMLTVGEAALIEGNVDVPYLRLDGRIVGDVRVAETVELAPHAIVTGDIYYNRLEMAIGAEVNGQLIHVGELEQNDESSKADTPNLDQNSKEC